MQRTKIIFAIALTLFSTLTPLVAHAEPKYDPTFYSNNDILFYNPTDTNCSSGASLASGASTTTSIVASDKLKLIFSLLIGGGLTAVQASAVMGNMYGESGFNADAHETGNNIGFGLVQWSFGRRTNMEAYAASKGKPASDVGAQIDYLLIEYNGSYKKSLSTTDFATSTDIPKATEAWMRVFEVPAMKPANDPARLNSVRIPAANQIYSLYKDTAPASTPASVTTTDCGTGNSAVSGNIVETAIGYALTSPASDTMNKKSDARDTYQAAKQQYNPSVDSTDCGGFIATVMIATGVDVNYPKVSVATQTAYVKSHPDKYLVILNPKASDLQPGDILLSNAAGHTTMYTGKTPYSSVDASLGQRVPSVRNSGSSTWMLSNGAILARVK